METTTTTNPSQAAIIDKIRKLLALSTSSNEHEAALAAAKAAALLDQYNIDMADLHEKPEAIGEHDHENPFTTIPGWISSLASITGENFNVKTILHSRRPAGSYRRVTVIRFIGTPTDTAIADYVFMYLQRTISKIAERTPTPPGINTRRFRESFKVGAVMGLRDKLEAIRRAAAPVPQQAPAYGKTSTDIAVVKNDAIAYYLRAKYPKLRTQRSSYRPSATGYHAGAAAGRNININAGINQGNGTRRIA